MKFLFFALFSFCAVSFSSTNQPNYLLDMSDDSKLALDQIIHKVIIPNQDLPYGNLIDQVSSVFLGVPYVANTLVGGPNISEVLVVNLEGVDCFTYLDYVAALSKSNNRNMFLSALVNTRYKDSDVAYYKRKHFFTDWYAVSPQNATDVTALISPESVTVEKKLNQKADGSEFIKGLGIHSRNVTYIPTHAINEMVLNNLKTGDYIGIYSPIKGLDVSHTGIVIRKDNQVWYRNASSLSKNMKVVDTNFLEYISTKTGIIVLRPII